MLDIVPLTTAAPSQPGPLPVPPCAYDCYAVGGAGVEGCVFEGAGVVVVDADGNDDAGVLTDSSDSSKDARSAAPRSIQTLLPKEEVQLIIVLLCALLCVHIIPFSHRESYCSVLTAGRSPKRDQILATAQVEPALVLIHVQDAIVTGVEGETERPDGFGLQLGGRADIAAVHEDKGKCMILPERNSATDTERIYKLLHGHAGIPDPSLRLEATYLFSESSLILFQQSSSTNPLCSGGTIARSFPSQNHYLDMGGSVKASKEGKTQSFFTGKGTKLKYLTGVVRVLPRQPKEHKLRMRRRVFIMFDSSVPTEICKCEKDGDIAIAHIRNHTAVGNVKPTVSLCICRKSPQSVELDMASMELHKLCTWIYMINYIIDVATTVRPSIANMLKYCAKMNIFLAHWQEPEQIVDIRARSTGIDHLVIIKLSQQLLLDFGWQRPRNLQNGGLILPGLTAAGIRRSCSRLLTPSIVPFSVNMAPGLGWGWWGLGGGVEYDLSMVHIFLLSKVRGNHGSPCSPVELMTLHLLKSHHSYALAADPRKDIPVQNLKEKARQDPTTSISTAYFCQVLGDEPNYPAIHLLVLHPNLSIPPSHFPRTSLYVHTSMRVCVCVCSLNLRGNTTKNIKVREIAYAALDTLLCSWDACGEQRVRGTWKSLQRPVKFLAFPSLKLIFIHGPHCSCSSIHPHKASVKTKIVAHSILGAGYYLAACVVEVVESAKAYVVPMHPHLSLSCHLVPPMGATSVPGAVTSLQCLPDAESYRDRDMQSILKRQLFCVCRIKSVVARTTASRDAGKSRGISEGIRSKETYWESADRAAASQ
ncbi:hypothetical protein DNTS_011699 [Danionella cerebrum]|uniref:Uncharacterized protein n=1 Tax=Danionella cerebrum TaxID=2873325 RepID=A0A553QU55_9TELE|nr:hypothetical protein DNTS_011699 [Danionella translucida]